MYFENKRTFGYYTKKIVVLDIDGTLLDEFKRIDRGIVSAIFKDNNLVKVADSIAWFFNGMDLFPNTRSMLRFRLKMYCFLSGKNYEKVLSQYDARYVLILRLRLRHLEKELKQLEKKFRIVYITNNIFEISIKSICFCNNMIDRYHRIKDLKVNGTFYCMVGNNFCDDLFIAKLLKIPSIYVGNSFLVSWAASIRKLNFDDVIQFLLEVNS